MKLATLERLAGLGLETETLVSRLRESLVQIKSGGGQGAGVIWSSEGLILTNDHVASTGRVEIITQEGRTRLGTVIARDPSQDLAAIRVEQLHLPAAQLGDETNLRIGELVIAVGNPFGVVGTATLGIVSAKGGHTWIGRSRRELLQADVELAPGNSGGPLATMEGKVVGINAMVLSPGIAAAIPVSVAKQFVERLRRN